MIARKAFAAFRTIAVLGISVCLMGAGDPFSGVWKLNVSKSILPPPVPKSQTVYIEVDAGGIRVREEIVSDKGERTTVTVNAKFDGKDYPITGSPLADTVSYQRVNITTIKGTAKKGGKVVANETAIVSRDGQTLTGTYSGTDPTGKPVTGIAAFEKQR